MGNKLAFPDKHVVIVGGGYGGSEMAKQLMKEGAKFTMIDTRDHMHHNMAAIRAVIQPGFVPRTMVPFKPAFGDHFMQGKVVQIKPEEKKVTLKSGEDVCYDYLVLATGTTGPFPCKLKDHGTAEASKMYEDLAQKVKNSQTVTVVGGGAAGVELAGEIASEYPDKQVTLVHSRTKLLDYPAISAKFHTKLMDILCGFKIKMVLGERVKDLDRISPEGEGGTVCTEKGTAIPSDLILKATGLYVNSDAYKDSELCQRMEKNGQLRVDDCLRVNGYKDIYAIGDCNNTPENKLAFLAEHHASYVVKNIKQQEAGKEVQQYKINSIPVAAVLALSRSIGMAQLSNGIMLPGFVANRMKAANVRVDDIWKRFGQKPPPE